MVSIKEAIEIITYAEDSGIMIWLDGGWGVDALLETQTRIHEDIDLFMEKRNGETFIEVIKEKGFYEIQKEYSTKSHTVWMNSNDDRIIDLHLFVFNEQGDLVFEGETYSDEIFNGRGRIEDKVVSCINAHSQVAFHLGYEHDDNDAWDVKQLCEKFNIPIPIEYQ